MSHLEYYGRGLTVALVVLSLVSWSVIGLSLTRVRLPGLDLALAAVITGGFPLILGLGASSFGIGATLWRDYRSADRAVPAGVLAMVGVGGMALVSMAGVFVLSLMLFTL